MLTLRHIFLLSILVFLVLFSACLKDPAVNTDSDAKLKFSTDTLKFDTVFTTIGSSTKRIMIYNQYDKTLKISALRLMGGNNSYFKLNVDGLSANEVTDIEILPKDSLFIFVQVFIDPLNKDNPVSILDSIQFQLNGSLQYVKMQAIGQDVHLFNNELLTKDTEWIADKPYLIYNNLVVDTGKTLTIRPGVKVYLHNNASIVSVGTLKALGTKEKPIVFQGDRLSKFYQNMPSQWGAIALLAPGTGNEIHNALIKNAKAGIQIGEALNEQSTDLTITNSRIVNNGFTGIYAFRATIKAENLVVANCGYYLLGAFLGGDYQFTHCTFYNQVYFRKTSPSVRVSETMAFQDGETLYDLKGKVNSFVMRNSIIWGSQENEFDVYSSDNVDVKYLFDYCLLRTSMSMSNTEHFNQMTNWKYGDHLLSITNQDVDILPVEQYNFGLDTLSVAKDKGNVQYSAEVPYDLFGKLRHLNDKAPDLGAIERYEN